MPLVIMIPQAHADCAVNEDWPEAPCLDQIINGRYNQDDVNKWNEYYSYKGPAFMELKYLALNIAIKENKLQEWVDDSVINQNVYQYYFFSGRAPNIGQIHGDFDVITVNEETFTDEILILVEDKVRTVYYTGENIISVLADPELASVIFETGENAKLDVKIPRVYEIGPGPFILQNGEEVEAVKDADKCFFYATIETQEPGKIEIAFSAWPEYKELVEDCKNFAEEHESIPQICDPDDDYAYETCGIADVGIDMTGGFGTTLTILAFVIPSSIIIVGFLVWKKRK